MASPIRPTPAGAERAAILFAEHGPSVLRFARRRCAQLADDVLSETFAIAVRRADEIPHGRELPWLYVVAEHVLLNQLRTQQRAARFSDDLRLLTPGSAPAPELPIVGPELDELPDRERALLVMTALEGLTAAEAADRMAIPYGSARNALVSGRRRLAARLTAIGVGTAAAVLAALLVFRSHDHEPRSVARAFDASIAGAVAVHDVAVVQSPDDRQGHRYERWTRVASGTKTVRLLSSGREVTATADEALATAARRSQVRVDRAESQRLAALDVAAPQRLRTLLADPAVRATGADGPRVRGEDTTTFDGRARTPAGVQYAVRVVVGDRAASVLEVRAHPLAATGAAARPTTVRFTRWVPERPADHARPAPSAGDAPAGATAQSRAAQAFANTAPKSSHRQPGSAAPGHAATSGPTREADEAASSAPSSAGTTGPILRVRALLHDGRADQKPRMEPTQHDEIDAWLELGGRGRFRIRAGWREFAIRERAFDGTRAGSWTMAADGTVSGRSRRTRTQRLDGPSGRWLVEAWPTITAHAHDDGLPTGTTWTGTSALLLPVPLAGGLPGEVALDPVTRTPVELVVNRTADRARWISIIGLRVIPAGANLRLLQLHRPRD